MTVDAFGLTKNLGPRPDFKPEYLGPVWRRNEDGTFAMPEHTLGWQVIEWAMRWLRGADGTDGWKWTPEQARFVLWWYAVDEHGDWLYPDGVIQKVKGWGKDPLGAVLGAIEIAGPCRFDYWRSADGRRLEAYEPGATPIARRQINEPWVQVVGTAFEQCKNTMQYFQGIFTKAAKREFQITLNRTLAYAYGFEAKIEAIASAPNTIEGNRPGLTIANEPHHWIPSQGGDELKGVLERNTSKMRGTKKARILWITNAYDPNEGSVAQQIREAYELDLARGVEVMLYDSIEAPEDVPLLPDYTYIDENGDRIAQYEEHDGLQVMVPPSRETVIDHLAWLLKELRGDAWWLSAKDTAKDIMRADSDMTEMRRYYTNAIVSGESNFVADSDVKATIHPDLRSAREGFEAGDVLRTGWMLVEPDDEIVLFFDGSKSGDSTALVGCRVSDRYTFLVGLWEKPRGDRGRAWLAPREAIDARVHEAFDTFNVVAFWADPSHAKDDADGVRYWDGLIDSWHLEWGTEIDERLWASRGAERPSSIMWDMANPAHSTLFSEAVVRTTDEFDSRNVVWDGHPGLRQHLRNARRFMGKYGLVLRKPGRGSSKKIDAAVCFVGARMLARLVQNKPEKDPKRERVAGETWIPVRRRGRR